MHGLSRLSCIPPLLSHYTTPPEHMLALHFTVGVDKRNQDSKTTRFARLEKTRVKQSNDDILYILQGKYGSYSECEGACVRTYQCYSYSWAQNGTCYLWKGEQTVLSQGHSAWHSGHRWCPHNYVYSSHLADPKCYRCEVTQILNWPLSQKKCEKEGAEIVSIETAEEHLFLANYFLHNLPPRTDRGCVYPFKYGGANFTTCIRNDRDGTFFCGTTSNVDVYNNQTQVCPNESVTSFRTSGLRRNTTWTWNSTGKLINYKAWAPYKPDEYGDCLGVGQHYKTRKGVDPELYWYNFRCGRQTHFMCEQNPRNIVYSNSSITGILHSTSTTGIVDGNGTTGIVHGNSTIKRNSSRGKKASKAYLYIVVSTVTVLVAISITVALVCVWKRRRNSDNTLIVPEILHQNIRLPSDSESIYEKIDTVVTDSHYSYIQHDFTPQVLEKMSDENNDPPVFNKPQYLQENFPPLDQEDIASSQENYTSLDREISPDKYTALNRDDLYLQPNRIYENTPH